MAVEAVAFDSDGNPVDPSDPAAAWGEIIDDDGTRTYWGRTPAGDDADPFPSAAMADADEMLGPENQDAPYKTAWDLYTADQEPVETHSQLLAALGWDQYALAEQRAAVCNLLELPAWDAAPEQLKRETYAWLVATRA